MSEREPQFLEVATSQGSTRQIAYLHDGPESSAKPGAIWLGGLKSDMVSTKASMLARWADAKGWRLTRFDYAGHGASEGDFADFVVGDWIEDSYQVFKRLTSGPQILIGSSMGGWIALALLRRLLEESPEEAARTAGLLLIAPAWDMTSRLMWDTFPDEVRAEIMDKGVWLRPSAYGDDPYPITRALIEDGKRYLMAEQPFDPQCPVRILQGQRDPDVPWRHALALVDLLLCDDIQLTLVKDGEHRLSRPGDLALLAATLDGLMAV